MKKTTINKTIFSGLFIALGLILPLLTMHIPQFGRALLPMHIPILLCGFICGWQYGLVTGFITPLLGSLILLSPPFMVAVPMAFELAIYGLIAGILYKIFPKKPIFIYISLIISMISGRIMWGIVSLILAGIQGNTFGITVFINGVLLTAIPGILIQLILIPLIVMYLKRSKLIMNCE